MNAVTKPVVSPPRHFINGEFVAARAGLTFEVVDPANQSIIDHFVDAHFFSNRKA